MAYLLKFIRHDDKSNKDLYEVFEQETIEFVDGKRDVVKSLGMMSKQGVQERIDASELQIASAQKNVVNYKDLLTAFDVVK